MGGIAGHRIARRLELRHDVRAARSSSGTHRSSWESVARDHSRERPRYHRPRSRRAADRAIDRVPATMAFSRTRSANRHPGVDGRDRLVTVMGRLDRRSRARRRPAGSARGAGPHHHSRCERSLSPDPSCRFLDASGSDGLWAEIASAFELIRYDFCLRFAPSAR